MTIFDKTMAIIDGFCVDQSAHIEPFCTALLFFTKFLFSARCSIWRSSAGRSITSKELYMKWDNFSKVSITMNRNNVHHLEMMWPIHDKLKRFCNMQAFPNIDDDADSGAILPGTAGFENLVSRCQGPFQKHFIKDDYIHEYTRNHRGYEDDEELQSIIDAKLEEIAKGKEKQQEQKGKSL